jgi:hypothetical protein
MPQILPPWQDELTPEQLAQFEALQGQPTELMEVLRNDLDFLVAVARADTRPHLVHWFSEIGFHRREEKAWNHDPERTGPIGPLAAGVEWSWRGKHDDDGIDGAFNGIGASDREVIVRGMSLMSVEKDDSDQDQFRVRRYVDWAGVFAQLGLTLNWRTPVENKRQP